MQELRGIAACEKQASAREAASKWEARMMCEATGEYMGLLSNHLWRSVPRCLLSVEQVGKLVQPQGQGMDIWPPHGLAAPFRVAGLAVVLGTESPT